MNRFAYQISPALIALTLLGLGLPSAAQAQEPAKDLVAFKASLTGSISVVTIPWEPPILSVHQTYTGQSDLLGQVTWMDHHYSRTGVDGLTKSAEGIGVITGQNGDSLLIEWFGGPGAPPNSAGVVSGEFVFIVRGGRGRFVGATGSGAGRWTFDTKNVKPGPANSFEGTGLTWSVEGMVSRPKP